MKKSSTLNIIFLNIFNKRRSETKSRLTKFFNSYGAGILSNTTSGKKFIKTFRVVLTHIPAHCIKEDQRWNQD